jgi:hypothetical protein
MDISLIGANIVILAENHNPSIISKEWLSQKRIIVDDFIKFTHTPAFSVVETEFFSLVVDQDRFQLSIKGDFQNKIEDLKQSMLTYVQALPEVPYSAVGFNFLYKIEVKKDVIKEIFRPPDEIFKELFSENYQLGGIIKFKNAGFLVTINLQPNNNNNEYHEIKADVNFHYSLGDSSETSDVIEKYYQMKETSENILERLFIE